MSIQTRINRKTTNRKRKRISIRFGPKDLNFMGFTMDISPEGLSIKTRHIFSPGMLLILELTVDGASMPAQGEVTWAKKTPPSLIRNVHSGIGIRFTQTSGVLREYLQILFPHESSDKS